MTEEQKEKCLKIIEHYGFKNQLGILTEELAELIQAVSKVNRNDDKITENFIEELADVSIMIEQIKQVLSDVEYLKFLTIQSRKIERQLARIKGIPERNCTNCYNQACTNKQDEKYYCGNWQARKRVLK